MTGKMYNFPPAPPLNTVSYPHEFVPISARSAEQLATHFYGFSSVEELAQGLPNDAQVLDVGAGRSNFGKTVAGLRPDITWINGDVQYPWLHDCEVEEIFRGKPDNVHYVTLDILRPCLQEGTFDRIFSHAMLPYIELTERKLAHRAVMNMASALRDGGLLFLGRKCNLPARRSPEKWKGSVCLTKQDATSEITVKRAVHSIRFRGPIRVPLRMLSERDRRLAQMH